MTKMDFSGIAAAKRIGRALRRACDEHGIPNSFGPSELAEEYGAPAPGVQGKIGRDGLRLVWVQIAADIPDITYEDRRWVVRGLVAHQAAAALVESLGRPLTLADLGVTASELRDAALEKLKRTGPRK
jgi:hypothetical protein